MQANLLALEKAEADLLKPTFRCLTVGRVRMGSEDEFPVLVHWVSARESNDYVSQAQVEVEQWGLHR